MLDSGDASIEIFEHLVEVAERYNVSQTAWAKSAWPKYKDNPQTRISELRRVSDVMRTKGISQAEASKIVKRRCTHSKILALIKGLVKMIPAEARREYFKSVLKDPNVSTDEKLMHLIVASGAKTKEQVLGIWEALAIADFKMDE
jgi:hypothetical protein